MLLHSVLFHNPHNLATFFLYSSPGITYFAMWTWLWEVDTPKNDNTGLMKRISLLILSNFGLDLIRVYSVQDPVLRGFLKN